MEKKTPKAIPILIAVAIIVVVIIMVGILRTGDTNVQQWDTVPVTITRVDERHNYSINSTMRKKIYVSYEYNGVWYEDIWLRGEGVLMESGGQRYAKVNPENPGQVSTVKNTLQINSDFVFVVFFAVVVIGILVLFFGGDKEKTQNEY